MTEYYQLPYFAELHSAKYGWTIVYGHLMCRKFKGLYGIPWGWRRRAPKRVGVLIQHCNLVYEKWCMKRWFDEDNFDTFVTQNDEIGA